MHVTDIPLVRLALRVLSERVLTLLSMIMTFALAAWQMYEPTYQRGAMAAFFAVAVFLPCILHDRRRDNDKVQTKDREEAERLRVAN